MLILTSRSATVLVIFIVACVAFCLASVFGAMTGPISILPNESSGGVLDNLSVITDSDNSPTTYGYDDSHSYSQSSSEDSQSSSSQVETTTDESSQSNPSEPTVAPDSSHSESSSSGSSSSSSGSSNVETTTG